MSPNAMTWTITALATAGVILRPMGWPEFIWAVAGAALLCGLRLISLPDAVGRPSCTSMAEAASSAIAVAAMPSAAVLPPPDRVGTDTSAAISCARASRCVHRSTR